MSKQAARTARMQVSKVSRGRGDGGLTACTCRPCKDDDRAELVAGRSGVKAVRLMQLMHEETSLVSYKIQNKMWLRDVRLTQSPSWTKTTIRAQHRNVIALQLPRQQTAALY